jgi:predicted metal-dependent hydrolase
MRNGQWNESLCIPGVVSGMFLVENDFLKASSATVERGSLFMYDTLVRSRRRTLSIEITPEGRVIVRAPLRMPKRDIEGFVKSKADWIWEKQEAAKTRPAIPAHRFEEGEILYYLGIPRRLHYDETREAIGLYRDILVIPKAWMGQAKEKLREWLIFQAEKELTGRVKRISTQTGLIADGIRITSAKTRWGSCSGKNRLCFSFMLIMAPPEAIDAVVLHELCHTLHHDHSRAFWDEVLRWMPEYPERRAILKQNRMLYHFESQELK